jgi:hypothetical protein
MLPFGILPPHKKKIIPVVNVKTPPPANGKGSLP